MASSVHASWQTLTAAQSKSKPKAPPLSSSRVAGVSLTSVEPTTLCAFEPPSSICSWDDGALDLEPPSIVCGWDDGALDLEPLDVASLAPLAPLPELAIAPRSLATSTSFAKCNEAVVAPPKVATCKKAAPAVRPAPQVSSKLDIATTAASLENVDAKSAKLGPVSSKPHTASASLEGADAKCNGAIKDSSKSAKRGMVISKSHGAAASLEGADTQLKAASEDASKPEKLSMVNGKPSTDKRRPNDDAQRSRKGSDAPKNAAQSAPSDRMGVGMGLVWRQRVGGWRNRGVQVLAAWVGVFQAAYSGAVSTAQDFNSILSEVKKALIAEVPSSSKLVTVHWGPTYAGNRTMRAAVAGDPVPFHQLRPMWQHRQFGIEGSCSLTWSDNFDTASGDHQQRVASWVKRDGGAHRGFVLELLGQWFDEELGEGERSVDRPEVVVLQAGDHWFDFVSLFGEVTRAEIIAPADSDESIAILLVEFAHVNGAHCAFEALTDRYLFHLESWHPVTCQVSDFETMRQKLTPSMRPPLPSSLTSKMPATASADVEETKFELHRHSLASAGGCVQPPPEVISITTRKRWLIVGRDDASDVTLKHPHISKSHAALSLEKHPESGEFQLLVQDTSSNGTWLNQTRMPKGELVKVQVDDRISFLQPVPSMDGVLTYGVMACEMGGQPSKRIRVRETAELEVAELGGGRASIKGADSLINRSKCSEYGQHSDPHEEDICIWLRRFGIESLLTYEEKLIQQYETVSQIRELYKDCMEAFFEDCSIEDIAHRTLFKAAIGSHLGALPSKQKNNQSP